MKFGCKYQRICFYQCFVAVLIVLICGISFAKPVSEPLQSDSGHTLKMRGVMLNLRSVKATDAAIENLKHLFDVFAGKGLNTLVLEIGENMQYDSVSFPHAKKPFSKAQLRDLTDYAADRGMAIVPYLQTLSHVHWILANPKNTALLENPNNKTWHAAWCPLKAETKQFLRNVLNEQIEVFKPKYFHVGLDEIAWGPYAMCPICSKMQPEKILKQAMMYTHKILKARGVRMIVYHDEFLPAPNHHNYKDVTCGSKILDSLPKDIVFNIWFYSFNSINPDEMQSEIDYFASRGFDVVGAVFLDPVAMREMCRIMSHIPQGLGSIITYWYHAKDWSKFQVNAAARAATTLHAMICLAPNQPIPNVDPVYCFSSKLPGYPNWEGCVSTPLFIERSVNAVASKENSTWPPTLEGVGYELPDSPVNVHGITFIPPKPQGRMIVVGADGRGGGYPQTVNMDMNIKAKMLAFCHATDIPTNKKLLDNWSRVCRTPRVGTYIVTYADGTTCDIPLLYRRNITDYNDTVAPSEGFVVFSTHAKNTALMQFSGWVWENPKPDKTIKSIRLQAEKEGITSVALFAVTALNKPEKLVYWKSFETQKDVDVWNLSATTPGFRPKLSLSDKKIHGGKSSLQIACPPTPKEQRLRVVLDAPIKVTEVENQQYLNLWIYVDSPVTANKIIRFGLYLGDSDWTNYMRIYKNLKLGWNYICIKPSELFGEGRHRRPSLSQIKQIRLSFWLKEKLPAVRIYIDDLGWSCFRPIREFNTQLPQQKANGCIKQKPTQKKKSN